MGRRPGGPVHGALRWGTGMTGHEFRKLREAAGISNARMARRLGIRPTSISHQENAFGTRPVRPERERLAMIVTDPEMWDMCEEKFGWTDLRKSYAEIFGGEIDL